jgi:hypothetical protein
MKLHEYTVFELEMIALNNWLSVMAHCDGLTFNSTAEFNFFLNKYLPLAPWGEFSFATVRPTQTVKVIYLKEYLGQSYQFIQKKMGMSPNRIQKVLKEGFIPSRPDDPVYDQLIHEWKKLRPFLPNEIFVKWLR